MPLNAEKQRAKRTPVVDSEPTFVIEAGEKSGITDFRHEIQYGFDIQFFLNYELAMADAQEIERGTMPYWHGNKRPGGPPRKRQFLPTWAKIYRADELIWVYWRGQGWQPARTLGSFK